MSDYCRYAILAPPTSHAGWVIGSAETGNIIYVCDILPLMNLMVRQQDEQHHLAGVVNGIANSGSLSRRELEEVVVCSRETLLPGLREKPEISERKVAEGDLETEMARYEQMRGSLRWQEVNNLFVRIHRHGLLRLLQLRWRYRLHRCGVFPVPQPKETIQTRKRSQRNNRTSS